MPDMPPYTPLQRDQILHHELVNNAQINVSIHTDVVVQITWLYQINNYTVIYQRYMKYVYIYIYIYRERERDNKCLIDVAGARGALRQALHADLLARPRLSKMHS